MQYFDVFIILYLWVIFLLQTVSNFFLLLHVFIFFYSLHKVLILIKNLTFKLLAISEVSKKFPTAFWVLFLHNCKSIRNVWLIPKLLHFCLIQRRIKIISLNVGAWLISILKYLSFLFYECLFTFINTIVRILGWP